MRVLHPRRAGFTLIELLVVISIISLLAAITAAAVTKVRYAQQAKNTSMMVLKLQEAVDQQWKAVVDDVMATNTKRPVPDGLVNYCGGDQKRARALWLYMQLRNEFPQSRAEAMSDVPPTPINGVQIKRKSTFANMPAGGTADEQAAALLYLILTEKSSGGANSISDEVTNSGQTETNAGRAFKDVYGNPITFRRFYGSGVNEVQAPPFINPNSTSKDSLDPTGSLPGWNNRRTAEGWVGADFDGQNKLITVISFGPNKSFENDPTGTTDDFWGYRVRRLGIQGD